MPIISTDLKLRLTGGAANANPNASLGGAKSTTEWSSAIFDNVGGDESAAGDVEYRCVCVHNNHGSLTAVSARIWIQVQTPSAATSVSVGLGTSAINGTEQTVANENTAPTGVTFSEPADRAGSLLIGDIPPGQHKATWIRRTVTAGATAEADNFTLRVECETAP
jgi:hypothetical protein